MSWFGIFASFFKESFMSSCELSGKSVLPIEPANNVSPVKISFFARSDMLPRVWPGV